MSRRLLPLVVLGALLAPVPARAQGRGQVDFCLASVSGVNFGEFSGEAVKSTGSIRILCSGRGTRNPFTISLSEGSSGDYSRRLMRSGTSSIGYNLYLDLQRTLVWGNGRRRTGVFEGSLDFFLLNSDLQLIEIYGQLFDQAAPPPGTYSDTIQVEVDF